MTSADRVREVLSYDPEVGAFYWKVRCGQRGVVGKLAGSRHSEGYWVIRLDGRLHKAHRLAFLYVHGREPVEEVDHVNGVRDDNRIANLREATKRQNQQNSKVHRSGRLAGTYWNKGAGKWMAQVRIDGKPVFLGYHPTEAQAHAAYAGFLAERGIQCV